MRRPSPALVISVIALVVACAGTATAAVVVTSRNVKDGSLRGRDLAANTVTGRNVANLSGRDVIPNGLDGSDIDENTLEAVPSAHALDGVRIRAFRFRVAAGTRTATVYQAGGLRVRASCSADGTLAAYLAPYGAGHGLLRVQAGRPGAAPGVEADNDFASPDRQSLVPGGADDVAGTVTFTQVDGDVTTIQYLAQSGVDPARGFSCMLAGTGLRTTP